MEKSQSQSPENTKISAKSPKKVRKMSTGKVVLVALAAGYAGSYFQGNVHGVGSLNTANTAVQQRIVSSEAEVISKVAKEVGESVVSIDVTGTSTVQDFFGYNSQVQQAAAGTGVIVSDKGIVITNKHVVPAGTATVKVTLSDGTQLDAEVLARDPRNDIAFVKIKDTKGKTLKAAKLGDSTKMEVGQKVIAIGNALGQFQNTVTSGIVSGYGRSITAGGEGSSEDLTNLIQTDAAINEGNSGGPLVNLSGEVIGINTAITSSSTGQSLGFSIPTSDIAAQITSVLATGKIERPYLGVRYQPITEKYAYIYNLPLKKGAYVPVSDKTASAIIPGSPADKAGLKEKDIIVKIGDDELDEKNDLVTVLSRHRVGDAVTLEVRRGDDTIKLEATLEATPGQ
jgi:serine protease Do